MKSIVRIHSFLIIGMLAVVVFGQQTAMAQRKVNSPGSVLHGRNYIVANAIMSELGFLPSLKSYRSGSTRAYGLAGSTRNNFYANPDYNQVTNLVQLSGITSLHIHGVGVLKDGFVSSRSATFSLHRIAISALSSSDLIGLTNLHTLDLSSVTVGNVFYPFPSNVAGSLDTSAFEHLPNLRTLIMDRHALKQLSNDLLFANKPLLDVWGFFYRYRPFGRVTKHSSFLSGDVDSPGSFFHGRPNSVTHQILSALADANTGITHYNQVTNVAQLRDIEEMTLYINHDYGLNAVYDYGLNAVDELNSLISAEVFDNLVNLRTLNLQGSELPSLPAGIFDNLVNLRTLKLQGTRSLSFQGNELTNLPPGVFDNLVNLQSLDLSHNQLTNLPPGVFDNLVNLQSLDLSHNQLTNLPPGVFDGLANLQTLNLEDNRLTSLPPGVFDDLVNLQTLDLENNQFTTTFPSGLFDRLTNLQTLEIENRFWSVLPPPGRITVAPVGSSEVNESFAVDFQVNLEGNRYVRPLFLTVIAGDPSDTAIYSQDYYLPGGIHNRGSDIRITPESTTATIRIYIRSDAVDELDQETFTLKVLAPSVPIITNSLSSIWEIDADAYAELKRTNPDPVFSPGEGVDEAGLVWTATVTIIDDDGPPTVSLSTPLNARVVEVTEGDEGATNNVAEVPVQLGLVSGKTAFIDYSTQDGTATAGQDYTATSGTLTFPAGTTTTNIFIPILGDAIDEPDEYFSVVLSNPTNSVLVPRTVEVKILDDDEPAPAPPPVNVNNGGGTVTPVITPFPSRNGGSTPGALMFNTEQVSLSESGSATYRVRATSSRGVENTIVNLATSHSGITINPNRLMFTPSDWQTYQTVTVTASADAADTNEQASIQHSIPASPGFIANNNAGSVSITLAHTVVEEEEEEEEPQPEHQSVQQQDPMPPTDYDLDDNGLIDISNLAQLNAIRWDLNGDGQPDKEEFAKDYALAFPSAIANMGVPHNIQTQGYELISNLNLDANEDETLDEADPFWNKGTGWQSIGLFSKPFQAVFEGNGHVIYNLFQDQGDAALFANTPSGLFGSIGNRGQVVGLGLEGVDIKGVNRVGALAGSNQGSISDCSALGRVEGVNGVGGLVGYNFGNISNGYVQGEVRGNNWVGGLAGYHPLGIIRQSVAEAEVSGLENIGSLTGLTLFSAQVED